MTDAQRRAVQNNRRRLKEKGLDRFEVRGLMTDKGLIRAIAHRLADQDAGANHLRTVIETTIGHPENQRGGILAALRRSPLVGAALEIERETSPGRDIEL